jgi:amino acid transporter
VALGVTWLAWSLYADAAISPSGTALVYVGTSARLSYALGKADMLPGALGKVGKKGVPFVSVVLAFVLGELMFAPFPSWGALIGLVSTATVIMYAFAPIALAALRVADGDRFRPYRLPAAGVLAPAGFVFANLIIYWAGSDTLILIMIALMFGLVLFFANRATVGRSSTSQRDGLPDLNIKASLWVWTWFAGLITISLLGQYSSGSPPLYGWTWMLNHSVIPEWWDYAVVAVFSLGIFYWGVKSVRSAEDIAASVALEQIELQIDPELSLTGPPVSA